MGQMIPKEMKYDMHYGFVLRFYGPVNPNGVMSSVVSLPNHTFTGQA